MTANQLSNNPVVIQKLPDDRVRHKFEDTADQAASMLTGCRTAESAGSVTGTDCTTRRR